MSESDEWLQRYYETELPQMEGIFEKLFPSPEGSNLPVIRFGNVVSPLAQRLPLPGANGESTKNEHLRLSWQDENLGVEVFVVDESGPRGIEIWANAMGTKAELAGTAVSVALQAEKGDRFKRVTVLLENSEEDSKYTGKAFFGSAAELRQKLGETVTIDVFLLG